MYALLIAFTVKLFLSEAGRWCSTRGAARSKQHARNATCQATTVLSP